jgi:hypothetical protein
MNITARGFAMAASCTRRFAFALSGDQLRMCSALRGYTGTGVSEKAHAPAGGHHQRRSH